MLINTLWADTTFDSSLLDLHYLAQSFNVVETQ